MPACGPTRMEGSAVIHRRLIGHQRTCHGRSCATRVSISATKYIRGEAPVQSVEEQQRGFTGSFEIVAAERPGMVAEKRRPKFRASLARHLPKSGRRVIAIGARAPRASWSRSSAGRGPTNIVHLAFIGSPLGATMPHRCNSMETAEFD
jgi:hypothetical protein